MEIQYDLEGVTPSQINILQYWGSARIQRYEEKVTGREKKGKGHNTVLVLLNRLHTVPSELSVYCTAELHRKVFHCNILHISLQSIIIVMK